MKKVIILLLIFSYLQAADFKGSLTTGVFTGTPIWNLDKYRDIDRYKASADYDADNAIEKDDTFWRTTNRLRLQGKFGQNFSFYMQALRSDDFSGDNHLSDTKIYQAYGKYAFSKGSVKAGRFLPFQRWIVGSVDGAAFTWQLTQRVTVSALGGLHVPYGLVYDSGKQIALGYADVAMRFKPLRAKIKVYGDEDVVKSGVDFYSRLGKVNINGNYGFDFTNSQIADGGLGAIWALNKKFVVNANYRLFRTLAADWGDIQFNSYLIERFLAGLRYEIWSGFYLDAQQMISMTSERKDYLSLLNLSSRYFNVGVNYLSGDSGLERLGLLLGGKYTIDQLQLSAGISPVDYLPANETDHLLTIAYYFRAGYRFLDYFSMSLNFNYYQDNPALESKFRGGVQLRYNFGS